LMKSLLRFDKTSNTKSKTLCCTICMLYT
jgi:hypothetical protein